MNPYTWLNWLNERDSKVLLLWLMQEIDHGLATEKLKALVERWRTNAERALHVDDWTATVDGYLEVRVDARMTTLIYPLRKEDDDASE